MLSLLTGSFINRYDPVVHEDFVANVLDPIYRVHDYPGADNLHSHRLSLFFIVLAHGKLYDSHPTTDNLGKTYYTLAHAAFSLEPIVNGVTSATVQALFMIVRFMYDSDPAGKEERWLLSGMCARIAQMVSLIHSNLFDVTILYDRIDRAS
jgi:hypothetical protein